jgi:hypothetical protein
MIKKGKNFRDNSVEIEHQAEPLQLYNRTKNKQHIRPIIKGIKLHDSKFIIRLYLPAPFAHYDMNMSILQFLLCNINSLKQTYFA